MEELYIRLKSLLDEYPTKEELEFVRLNHEVHIRQSIFDDKFYRDHIQLEGLTNY